MNRIKYITALAVAMTLGCALSACGGGGGSSPAASSAPVAQSAPKPVLIDAQGDSTMYGSFEQNGVYVQSPNNPPAVLQSLLQGQFGSSVTVQNNAIPGSTLAWRMYGIGTYSVPYTTYVHTDAAQIVLMNWDINDARPDIGEPAATYQQFLVDFVTLSRALGKTVVLEEPNPTISPQIQAPYVAAMDYVATQMNVPLVSQFDYIQSLPNWQSMLQPDGIHPSNALYQIKAQREEEVIAPIVKTLLQ